MTTRFVRAGFFLVQPEDALAALITTWYAQHLAAGGARDAVADDLIAEARAEDAAAWRWVTCDGRGCMAAYRLMAVVMVAMSVMSCPFTAACVCPDRARRHRRSAGLTIRRRGRIRRVRLVECHAQPGRWRLLCR